MGSEFGLDLSVNSDVFIFPGLGVLGESQVGVVYKVEMFKADVFTELSGHGLVIGGSVMRL